MIKLNGYIKNQLSGNLRSTKLEAETFPNLEVVPQTEYLDELQDVKLENIENKQILVYNSETEKWENQDPQVIEDVNWTDITGDQSDINISGFTNDSGFITDYTETDPIFLASQAYNIDAEDITNLGNLSGINTGDSASLPIGGGTLTGSLNLKTGTTTVYPIKLNAGTNLSVPISGVIEFDGEDLFITI